MIDDVSTPNDDEVAVEVNEEPADGRSDAERERDEFKDALQRLQADFKNYRKRVARTTDEVVARSVADVVAKLLPVLDAFDLAQAHFATATTDELESVEAKALVQARSLLLDTLTKANTCNRRSAGELVSVLSDRCTLNALSSDVCTCAVTVPTINAIGQCCSCCERLACTSVALINSHGAIDDSVFCPYDLTAAPISKTYKRNRREWHCFLLRSL